MKYSDILSESINRSGLSLTEISERSKNMGYAITTSYLSKLKNGKMPPPSYKVTVVLALILNVEPSYLLGASQSDSTDTTKEEIIEALQIAYPDAEYFDLLETALHIYVSPKDFVEPPEDHGVSNEEFYELIGGNIPDIPANLHTKTTKIPLLGKIPAGTPIEAIANAGECIDIAEICEMSNGKTFALKVEGDSMEGSRIYDGDIVIIRSQQDIENGEIAVVNVDGEDATLKRVKRIDGKFILFPDNPKYEPIIIDNDRARIVGKVIQVMFSP